MLIEGLYVLLDSGCSHNMLKAKYAKHVKWKVLSKPSLFSVAGGGFKCHKKATVVFSLPELTSSKRVKWKFHLDESKGPGIGYDMIIGRDMMNELGIDLLFS